MAGPSDVGVAGRESEQPSTDRPAGLHPAVRTGQYADLPGGVRLHYASCGERGRPLLLFVHGFPEFWYAWRNLLPMFGTKRDVGTGAGTGAATGAGTEFFAVAPDLRGYNLSSKPAGVDAYKPPLLAADLIALAGSLGYQRFTLVGHDWGGAVTWLVAQAYRDHIERLVILNSPHAVPFSRALADDVAQQQASAYMNFLRRPGSEDALLADDAAPLERMLRHDVGVEEGSHGDGSDWFTGSVRDAYRQAWTRPDALKSAINYYRASPIYPPIGDDPGARRLKLKPADFRIEVPTLVIWGERDRALLPVVLQGLDECVADLRIERLPGASHWLVHEQPERVGALIRQFIDPPRSPAN